MALTSSDVSVPARQDKRPRHGLPPSKRPCDKEFDVPQPTWFHEPAWSGSATERFGCNSPVAPGARASGVYGLKTARISGHTLSDASRSVGFPPPATGARRLLTTPAHSISISRYGVRTLDEDDFRRSVCGTEASYTSLEISFRFRVLKKQTDRVGSGFAFSVQMSEFNDFDVMPNGPRMMTL